MVTASIGHDHYNTQLSIGLHTLIADEALEVGGTDSGPSPGQILMASLASCTAITLRMYADRKQWAVEKIKVEVNAQRVENTTVFTRDIELTGVIDHEQRNKLLEIANRCPVHKTLTNPIEIKTQLI